MQARRVTISVLVLTVLALSARNQDAKRLEAFSPGAFPVRAVYVDAQGVKWFGTGKGLLRYDNVEWRYFGGPDLLPDDRVYAITPEQTAYGPELWVSTPGGVAALAAGPDGITGATNYTVSDGLLDNRVNDVAVDSRHGKFIGTDSGLNWFHDGIMDSLTYDDYPGSLVDAPVRRLAIYRDSLYVAAEGGIGRFVSGVDGVTGATRWTSEYGISPQSGNILSAFVDFRGHQWFGTDEGVQKHEGYRAKQDWTLYYPADGLVERHVIAIAEDSTGGMWFGTFGGVSRLDEGAWTSYTRTDGLLSDTVYGIGFDPDGSVWFGTHAGVCRLSNGGFGEYYTGTPPQVSALTMKMHACFDPVSGSIRLAYRLDREARLTAELYHVSGRLAGKWTRLPGSAGTHHLDLPVADRLPEGVYILHLAGSGLAGTEKLLIIP